jgi:two-component system, cell cycle response regulator DivK
MSDGVTRVLLVEDNEDELQIYSTMLYYNNFDVAQASNAYEAIMAVFSDPPDVILMDLNLPGLNGFSAVEILKSNSASRSIPIVCFTAHNISRETAIARGCAEVLYKPVPTTQLVAAILDCKSKKAGRTADPPVAAADDP